MSVGTAKLRCGMAVGDSHGGSPIFPNGFPPWSLPLIMRVWPWQVVSQVAWETCGSLT